MKTIFATLLVLISLAATSTAAPEYAVRIYVHDDADNVIDSYGSGVLVSKTQILTNWHVVKDRRRGAGTVQIRFKDGTRKFAIVIKQNRTWDIALLIIQEATNMCPIKIGNDPKPGDKVTIAGFGYDYEYIESHGIVNNIELWPHNQKRGTPGLFQIGNLVARQGDSGGPTTDQCGRLVGILFGTCDKRRITEGTNISRIKQVFGSAFKPSCPRPEQSQSAKVIPPTAVYGPLTQPISTSMQRETR